MFSSNAPQWVVLYVSGFPRSDTPICAYMPLGDTFKPAYFGDTCNTAGTFIQTNLTYPHTRRARRQPRFHGSFVLTRTFSVSSVCSTTHSHHRHFIDPRRIICTQHLCRAFVNRLQRCYGKLPPTSASSQTFRVLCR